MLKFSLTAAAALVATAPAGAAIIAEQSGMTDYQGAFFTNLTAIAPGRYTLTYAST